MAFLLPERKLRVELIQDEFNTLRNRVFDDYISLVNDIAAASVSVSPTALANAQAHQRKGQFYLDYIVSENSHGFHAPVESARILNLAKEAFQQGKAAPTAK